MAKLLDENSLLAIRTFVNNKISTVYQPKGSETVSNLNSATKVAGMNGYVYNLTTGGTLTNQDGSTVTVISGDNVVFLWNDGTWKWDPLGGFVDLSNYLTKNTAITGATKCKITYDSKGLVTAGADLAASDIPDLSGTYVTLTSSQTITGSKAFTASITVKNLNDNYPKTLYESSRIMIYPRSSGWWAGFGFDPNDLSTPKIRINNDTDEGGYVITIPFEDGVLATRESVNKYQRTTTVVQNARNNINGYTLSSYSAELTTSGGYTYYHITRDSHECSESDVANYMARMTGSYYVPKYDQDYPRDSILIFADGSMWKPQYNNGVFNLYRLQDSYANTFVLRNAAITGATKCKITYDSKGLVTAGADLAASDIPDLSGTYVTLTGNQTITGTKTIKAAPIIFTKSDNTEVGRIEYNTTDDYFDFHGATSVRFYVGSGADLTAFTVKKTSSVASVYPYTDKSLSLGTTGNQWKDIRGETLYENGVSLATKYQAALTAQTAYTSKGSATKVPQITTNSLGQVTGITEVDISFPATGVTSITAGTGLTTTSGSTTDGGTISSTGTIYLTKVLSSGSTKCKVTYDVYGRVTAGADLVASDIPDLSGTYLALTSAGTQVTYSLSGTTLTITTK